MKNLTNNEQEQSDTVEEYTYSTIADLGVYPLWGEINESSSRDLCDWIMFNNLKPQYESLSIVINSGGGVLSEAYAIIDTIKSSKIPINTYAIGMVGSGALMIFLTGKNRTVAPNTHILSHELAGMVDGGATKMINEGSHIKRMYDQMVEHYRFYTKLSVKKIQTTLLPPHKDVYLTPEEAIKYNICTNIGYLDYQ